MRAEGTTKDYLELPLGRFLDLTASREPAPGGGAAAAVAVALAAALSGMAARFSEDHLEDAAALAGRADGLREEASRLARDDAAAYARVLAAGRSSGDPDLRRRRVKNALSDAADVPLTVAEAGVEVAGIAAHLAQNGNPNLRGDAICAAVLAEAGTEAAAVLVEMNLSDGGFEDSRLARAEELARNAAAYARRAREGARLHGWDGSPNGRGASSPSPWEDYR
ncbi:MAG: cyclodeaminase/cyclohydrolase family protein [Actinomycetota bacterium]|nr:cyclodeaminase/cyclohydrolase family protein [Actinomycetota bacterium]PLS84034.1 MAG: formiminotransferase-cyclodeaminase [Actinomycetota bacterium]